MDSSSPALWWIGLVILVILVVLFVWWVWCGCSTTACPPPPCPPPPCPPVTPSAITVETVEEGAGIAPEGNTQVITGTNLGNVRAVSVPDDAVTPTGFKDAGGFSVSPDGTTLTFIVPSQTVAAAGAGDVIAHLLPRADSSSTAAIPVVVG